MLRWISGWIAVLGLFMTNMAWGPSTASGQVIIIDPRPPIIIRPPHPPFPHPMPPRPAPEYKLKSVDVQANIKDQAAKVQVSQVFQNTGSTTLEAQFVFPIPDSAAISGVTLMVDGKELTGKLLKKEDARRIYEEIVRRQRDPALLEYMGQGLFQTSVFPIPPQAERTVEIRYSQLLRKDNGLVDLMLPLGTTKHSNKAVETFNVTIRVETAEQIKTIYSPSHQLDIQRPDNTHAVCKLTLRSVLNPDDLRLLYGTTGGLVGVNLISYKPQDSEDGYFVLLAAPDMKAPDGPPVSKTQMFVFDRSGSMSGKKIEQAKEALKFLVQRLNPGDTFNIVSYDSAIESFRPELQKADEATVKAALGFVEGLHAGGGTNIDGALQTALKMLADSSRPNYVLFMTDGLPTVGEQNEQTIAAHAKEANKVNARMFNFGVGFDVNSRLLDRLSRDQRGQSVYVRPNENIEAHVASLQTKIGSPLLTDIALAFEFDQPASAELGALITRTYPRQLTDLFQGEQLIYVGRYKTAGAAKVTLTGMLAGEKKTFTFPVTFSPKTSDETNGFVEKLWATRRIGEIIDELDLKGQNKELVDELVALSIKHGIITPYTSFLAEETVNLADGRGNSDRAFAAAADQLSRAEGQSGFAQRRLKDSYKNAPHAGDKTRSADSSLAIRNGHHAGGGVGGQTLSGARPSKAPASGPAGAPAAPAFEASGKGTAYVDDQGNEVETEAVRNVGQKTFFHKQNVWQDSTVTPEQAKNAVHITQYSTEYFDLAAQDKGTVAKYLAFEEPVLVNVGDKTYQIDPAKE